VNPDMGPAGYPPGANAWPNISPYGPAVDQHYIQNGFWFNKIISGQARYFGTLEGLITRTGAPPHAILGEQNVNEVPIELILDGITRDGFAGTRLGQFVETEGRPNNPDRSTDQAAGGGNNGNNQTFVSIFNPTNAGVLQQRIGSGGIRGTWGWWNPDQSGFMVQGFGQAGARSTYQVGDTTLPQQLLNARTDDLTELAQSRIRPWLGLALPGNDRDADGLAGVVVPYDLYVSLEFKSTAYGGNLDWYFAPFYDRDYLKIRSLAGARVMSLNEWFSFDAADSGLGYTLTALEQDGGGGGNNGQDNTNPFDLRVDTLDEPPYDSTNANGPGSPIRSYLASRTEGLFAGPEVGVRVDVGGERFKIWLQSKAGLLAYQATRKISGFNIGDHYNIINTTPLENDSGLPEDPDVDGDDIPDNPTRAAGITGTSFQESKTTTSVAPMFEQGIFLQAPILSYVPVIKKLSVFENAEFQAGYTFTVLGAVYRPTDTIEWRQFPDFPTLEGNKSKYYTQNVSLGVHWNY